MLRLKRRPFHPGPGELDAIIIIISCFVGEPKKSEFLFARASVKLWDDYGRRSDSDKLFSLRLA